MAVVFAAVAEERDGIATEPPVDLEARASWSATPAQSGRRASARASSSASARRAPARRPRYRARGAAASSPSMSVNRNVAGSSCIGQGIVDRFVQGKQAPGGAAPLERVALSANDEPLEIDPTPRQLLAPPSASVEPQRRPARPAFLWKLKGVGRRPVRIPEGVVGSRVPTLSLDLPADWGLASPSARASGQVSLTIPPWPTVAAPGLSSAWTAANGESGER
jgi:hypothetical protein